MKRKLVLVITLLLLGFGGASLSTAGSDNNNYYEGEPWDDIYSQSKDGPTIIDTTFFAISAAGCPRTVRAPSPHKSLRKKGSLKRGRWSSLWSQIRSLILPLWR